MTRRLRRGIAGSVLIVLGLVIGAVIASALRADGREHSQADTNDGGAWLLKRDAGYVGHVNKVVGEVTAAVSAAEPASDYDIDQARDVILIHDRTTGVLTVVDDRTERIAKPNGVRVSADASVHAIDGGALVVDRSSMTVHRVETADLISLDSLEAVEPVLRGEGPTIAAVTHDGNAAVVDHAAGTVVFLRPDGSTETSPELELTDDIVSITTLGPDTAVLADGDGDMFVATPSEARPIDTAVTTTDGSPAPVILQQPAVDGGATSSHVIGATPDGRLVAIPMAGGDVTEIAQLPGSAPVAPIAYGRCVFAIVTSPPTYQQWCADADGGHVQRDNDPLDGSGSELRLRLVNGWVWINDVDSGAAWVTSPQQRLDRVEDWGSILSDRSDDADENNTDEDGGEVLTEIDPDDPNAEIVQSDEIDTEGPNRPPIARDDETQTRVDRPIDVDVLANDTDPNGDVLLVQSIESTGGDAIVAVNPDGRGVQVSPAAGFSGLVTFGYTITDGRDGTASAAVRVQVTPADGDSNRPPESHNDIAATRRGRPTTFDVLANDIDPDGDALVLESIALADPDAAAGVLVSDPSGQVVFTPDPNSTSERIELTYEVGDDFGVTDTGTVIVKVRLEDANNQPDARNDAGVTVVGKPVRLDVLDNDTDPDNDPLFIAQLPTLVRPAGQSADQLDLSLTPDGELFFNPTAAGSYVFNYAATDGEETDVAQIRVEVTEPPENRPPVAVRDDVVIPAGGTRLLYVLENDGDPDGDIIGLVGHTADDGLTVKEVEGIGYLVTVSPGAAARPTFRYQVSDGRAEPVSAVVVVAVTKTELIDQPPVARADVVEVRAGGKVSVPVLENDYDPEGGVLEVTGVTESPGAVTGPGLNGQTLDVAVGAEVVSSFTLSYTVADDAGNQSSAFVEVRIVPADEVNRPPIARSDLSRTRSGVPVLIEVVANDSDPDGDIIAVENIASQPGGGTARVENGAIVYAPGDTFTGTDRFTYALVDANAEIAIGEVLVGVMPLASANRAPEAFDDTVEVVAGSASAIVDVLDNDSDPDGDRVLVTEVAVPSAGSTAVADGGGAVTFTPPTAPTTPDGSPSELAFTYSVDDGRGGTDSATVTVRIIAATDAVAPIAVDDRLGPIGPGETVEIDLLENDLDPDGNPAELVLTSDDPALAQRSEGVLTYAAGQTSSRHTYTITDPAGLTDTAELAVLVVPNRAPVVAPYTGQTPANESITIDLAPQASDSDGDTLYFACCQTPAGGGASTVTNGAGQLTVTFDPDDEFAGLATFAYTVDDQEGHIVAGSVSIEVLPPSNRPPTATDATLPVEAGVPTNIDLAALASDPDPADTLRFTSTGPSNGAVQLATDGSNVQATAAIDQGDATDSFQYTVTDAAGQSATGTVTLTVTAPSAPPPQAQGDAATTNQGTAVTVDVLANDVDPLGQGLAVVSAGVTDAGETSTDGRQVTFTPRSDFFGPTSFVYRVRDGSNRGDRESEAQVAVTVIGQPSAPGSPNAVAGNAQATINWAAPPANGAPIDDYELSIAGGPTQSVGPTTGYTWSGLTNGQAVQFTVRAHNSAGWGPWSGPSPVVTPDIEPGRPASPSVQFADGALLVTWAPPANEGSAIINYDLQIGGSASAIQQVGNTTSYPWQGLTNGQEYTFMVRAVNARGAGEWSSSSAPEHPLRPPDAPGTPVGQRGDKTIAVSWSPGGNGGDPIIEYQIQLVSTGATNTTSVTGLTWSNLPNGQAQQFLVRSRNRANWGPWSPPSAPVVPCGVPDPVGPPSATRADGAANVTWAAPYDQGCAITSYRITNSQGGTTTAPAGATSATFAGLANGTSYTFTVTAINEVGAGRPSGASNPVVPAGAPGSTTATGATPDAGRVTIAYNGANANGSAITTYQLSVNGGGWENIGTSGSTTRGGLANSTTYSFQVRAVNDVGPGVPANTVSAQTPGPPEQVGGLRLGTARHEVSASWGSPAANGKPIDHYEADIAPGGSTNVQGQSHTFGGREDDTVYDVRVRACNEIGCGPWSATESIRTPPAPPPPTTAPPQVQVSWSKGASGIGVGSCSTSPCRWVNVTASGLTPNTTYSIQCRSRDHGNVGSPNSATSGGQGNLSLNNVCVYGYPGVPFWVVLTPGGHESAHRPW